MEHELKTVNPHFHETYHGRKTFEIRDATDRDFICDDTLKLREWEPETESYTGRWVRVYVSHILRNHPAVSDGYFVMSIERLSRFSEKEGLQIYQ